MIVDAGLSRRSMLFGAGSIAGATLLAGTATAAPPGEPPGVPTVSTSNAEGPTQAQSLDALPVVNPAWSYLMLAYPQFVARPVAGLNSTVNGTVGLNVAAGTATFFGPLALPQGAIVRQVAFECYNTSSSTGLGVGFTRTNLASSTVGGSFAFSTAGAAKHTIVLPVSAPFATIDNAAFSYALSAFLQPPETQFGFFGARLAYENGLSFTPVKPAARKLDTRVTGPSSGKLAGGGSRTVALTPQLPAGAKAALINLTVTDTVGAGFLTARAAGSPATATSNINWFGAGQTLANNATVAVSAAGAITVTAGGFGATHVIVDLLGYYA
jgi:hypothetical protein